MNARPLPPRRIALPRVGVALALALALATYSATPAQAVDVVPVSAVANGCGPGLLGSSTSNSRLLDTQTYLNARIDPTARRYTVNLRAACDLHDAGYGGFAVPDAINGGTIDYRAWTKDQVDRKFFNDLRILCQRQIPAAARIALEKCKTSGGPASLGASDYFWLVQNFGGCCFVTDPVRRGLQGSNRPVAPTTPPTTVPRASPTTTLPTAPTGPPATPINLDITATPRATELRWTDMATNETAYFVSDSVSVWRLPANQTSMTLGGVAAGLRVCLTVSAASSAGASPWAPYSCTTSQP